MAEQPHGQRGLGSVERNQSHCVEGGTLSPLELESPGLSLCVCSSVFPSRIEGHLLSGTLAPVLSACPLGGSESFPEAAHSLSVGLYQWG